MMKEKANILLVDDQPANLEAMQAVLEPLEQNVITALSGQMALKLLLEYDFAVILLDVNMPVMDGYETAVMIRERELSQNIPIIFLTASDPDFLNILKGYKIGAVDFIIKPILDNEILRYKVSVFVELSIARFHERKLEQEHQRVNDLQKELKHYRSLSETSTLPVGEAIYGGQSVKSMSPTLYKELTDTYGKLLDQKLEMKVKAVNYNISEQLRELARSIGYVHGGPRDVTEIHTDVLSGKTKKVTPAKEDALFREGRFLVLELMGYLVSFYRSYYHGTGRTREKQNGSSK